MAAPEQTLLQLLRTRTVVDIDSLDVEAAKSLGPFSDCTSNQAIGHSELQKAKHGELILASIRLAKENADHVLISPNDLPVNVLTYPFISIQELAVEIAMVKLQHQISKYITGFVHVQVNPLYASDTTAIIIDAIRIVKLFKLVDPEFDTARVCIKIPSTWEGIQACRKLEHQGIATLATTVFAYEQCVLAAKAGCHYIAPYVNELKVHFEPEFVDQFKLFALCQKAQQHYDANRPNTKTKVLPASLTSIDEVMMLAGVDHITVAPELLEILSRTGVSSLKVKSVFDTALPPPQDLKPYLATETKFREDMASPNNGGAQRKLDEAIMIFSRSQKDLEKMMESRM